jgi:hypothetical protein
MIDPQENIMIGNVLYALGLCIGTRAGKNAPPGAINLLQQTSYDKALGDVMLTFPSVTRLLEFKRRSERSSPKERAKLLLLSNAMRELPRKAKFSRAIHWYVETAEGEKEFSFAARSYLDMNEESDSTLNLSSFIHLLVDEALSPSPMITPEQANEYIQDMALIWGANETVSSTGLLLTVSGSGGLMYAVIENLADLARTGQQCRELCLEKRHQMERDLVRQQEHKLVMEHTKQLDRSYSHSMSR